MDDNGHRGICRGSGFVQQGKSTWIVKSVAQKTRNTFNAQLFATFTRDELIKSKLNMKGKKYEYKK
ncbi:MAG: hypothetical protein GQ470_01610 [Gammaproteobacteria bacterium]|nr:hypothetical protein [Gammaproteobacteria bacterium]